MRAAPRLLSAMLSEVGVELKIVPTEFPAKWIEEVFRNKDYDMTIVSHTEPLDIDIYARDTYYFNYKNKLRPPSPKPARPSTRRRASRSTPRRRRSSPRTCRRCSCSSCRSSASGTRS